MKFALVSPLRPRAEDWARLADFLAAEFTTARTPMFLGNGWKYNVGTDHKYHPLTVKSPASDDQSDGPIAPFLEDAFLRVRRNSFAIKPLGVSVALVVFGTGEACVVELHEANGATEDILRQIEQTRDASPSILSTATASLEALAKAAEVKFLARETTTHTILLSDSLDDETRAVATRCFQAEGLEFDANLEAYGGGHKDPVFVPGWSYSICVSPSPTVYWDCMCLMVRAQCEWYSVRVARDYCLRKLAETNLRQRISPLIRTERNIVEYQTAFRLWRHRMEEYRANLKPELTGHVARVDTVWNTGHAMDYVNETLAQARDLIQTSYSRRILLQERRQSLMIFILTALGVFSVASIATTYWDWMTLAEFASDDQVASPGGRMAVIAALGGLLFGMVCLVAWFVISRRKLD
ncbi:MAG: hypothetical protein AAF230_09140 [Pseudomonadota bacterium]